MTISLLEQAPAIRYAYKASLIGAAHQFELTADGLSWRVAGRADVWRYADITAIRLSYRPVSMQAHRFRADIAHASKARLPIISTSWQTAALMAPQDNDYRAFITELHKRMARAGSRAVLTGGLRPNVYALAVTLVALLALRTPGARAGDGRVRRRAVSCRIRCTVRLAGRRLPLAQPAASLHIRAHPRRAVAVTCRNET